jgi:hypothetical protein
MHVASLLIIRVTDRAVADSRIEAVRLSQSPFFYCASRQVFDVAATPSAVWCSTIYITAIFVSAVISAIIARIRSISLKLRNFEISTLLGFGSRIRGSRSRSKKS